MNDRCHVVPNFRGLTDDHVGDSFDTLVECGLVDSETARLIVELGYYGIPITADTLASFNAGHRFSVDYALINHGCDGCDMTTFSSKAELVEELRRRAAGEYWDGPEGFHGDYSRTTIVGATLQDAGFTNSDGFVK